LIARAMKKGLERAMLETMSQVKGAYSMVIMTEDSLLAFRDPHGFRPLCLGRLNSGYVLTSETCALDLVEAEYVREVEPGEILIINSQGIQSVRCEQANRKAQCILSLSTFQDLTARFSARMSTSSGRSRESSWQKNSL